MIDMQKKNLEAEDNQLRWVCTVFNNLFHIIFYCVKDEISPMILAETGRTYVKKKLHMKDEIVERVFGRDGQVAFEEMDSYCRSAGVDDRISFCTGLLNHYLFFSLVSANAFLPINEQQHLVSRVFDIHNKMIHRGGA